MQKRLVRKLDLEIALSKLEQHPSPIAFLEQYAIPPATAAELLYVAAYGYDDIVNKTIANLGCGTGILAIGAALLGATEAVGVDMDKVATKKASKNAEKSGVKEQIQWVTADVATIRGTFDTVLQNPPFGVQRKKADRKFLRKALEIGKHVYSLHRSSEENRQFVRQQRKNEHLFKAASPSPFLKGFIEKYDGQIRAVYTMLMTIPHMFEFHRKRRHSFPVDLYVIQRVRT